MIELEITFLSDFKLPEGIMQMVDRERCTDTFIFIIEEEELDMLLHELNYANLNYAYNYEEL